MQEQKKRLDQLVEGKTKLEKKLSTVSTDLQSRDKKTRDDQQQLTALRQSLAQLSEREREVREGVLTIPLIQIGPVSVLWYHFTLLFLYITFTHTLQPSFHIFQLVDFRMVVSQMLGLNDIALARPNYEIIKLLETILHHHHHHLHHHVNMPWHCPTRSLHLPKIQDPTDSSSLDVSTLRSAFQEDAIPL